MTRASRRHERYVKRMNRTESMDDPHGYIHGAAIGFFLVACGVAGFIVGQVLHF